MTAQVVRLPTAAPDYITVRKAKSCWHVDLVTPCEAGRPIRTTLARTNSAVAAVEYARRSADGARRPLRLPKNLQHLRAAGARGAA